MTDIVQMSKGGAEFYPQTHAQAVLGLQDIAVGTNLYQDTRDFDNPSVWNSWEKWTKTGEKFNGLTVMASTNNWNGLGQNIQVKKGETYTFSEYVRYKKGTGKSSIYWLTDGKLSNTNVANMAFSLNETWQRISMTVKITADGSISPRIERSDNNNNTLLIAGMKLEKGSVATDWCPNPTEILTGALSDFRMPGQTLANKVNGEFNDRGVNVKWFGAKGDGVADDTEALKKARDFCDAKLHQVLFFPPGTYIFNETIQFENEVNLVGTDSSWLKYGGSGDALVFGANGMTIDNYQKNKRYSVSNLGFTGGENSTYGIHFNKFVTQAVVQNCNFENFGGTKSDSSCFAVWFDENNWYGLVQNCKFDVTVDGGIRQFVGMATFGNSRVVVRNNLVTSLSGYGVAVLLNGFNCQLIGNKIEGYQINVRLGSEASNTIIAYNYFEKSNNGSSGAVEIGDSDANVKKYPTGIYIKSNYCNLHEDTNGQSYFVSPSNSQALIKDLTISDNYINGYTGGNNAYIVYQNDIAGQTGNIAERNRGIGLAGIFRPQQNIAPWNGMDSIVQRMKPIGSGTLTKQILTTDSTAKLDILNPDYSALTQMKITTSKDMFLYHNARLLAKAFSTGQLAFGKSSAVCDYDFAGDLKAKTIGVSEQTNGTASAGQIFEGTDGNLYYINLKGQKKQLTS